MLGTTYAQTATPAHKDSMATMVQQYYDLNIKIFQKVSTPEQIDSLFTYFTSDFEYIHEKYGGLYTRQDLYEGYLNNQANGGYDGSIVGVELLRMITGLNAVAVERRYIQLDGPSEQQMTLFEFRNGKIKRIVEYW